MPEILQALKHCENEESLLSHAKNLLSQQVWCWGRDICREEGNCLLSIGFQRLEPPAGNEKSYSTYMLELPNERCVVLRGSGVFYSDIRYGSIFIPRYEFMPRYMNTSTLDYSFWAKSEVQEFTLPTKEEKRSCDVLIIDLIAWIETYEQNIVDCLGIGYRQKTLLKWDNGKRIVIPSEKIVQEWKNLTIAIL